MTGNVTIWDESEPNKPNKSCDRYAANICKSSLKDPKKSGELVPLFATLLNKRS